MATNEDNTVDLTDATPAEGADQLLDADLPVDAGAEAANAHVAKGFDKKKVAGLGIVVGLVIVAGIIVFSLSKKPTDSATATPPPMMVRTPPGTPPKPGKMPPPTSTQKPPATVNPTQPVTGDLARPGDASWVKGIKKPLPVPNDLQATPGQQGSNTPQVQVIQRSVGVSSAPANSKDAAMQRLWDSGAAAKHKGDNATARKDWKRILELDPKHAGIQNAINKLPK
ncbi:MAG: hypothetical protein ABI210_11070 [Abditibacteriaceae bacterium]